MDALGRVVPVAKQLPVAQQTVVISGTSAQSAVLDATTTLIRVHTDATCSLRLAANPTAVTTDMRMSLNQTEYFAVQPNSGLKIAVISNT